MWKTVFVFLAVLLLAGCQTSRFKEIDGGWRDILSGNYAKAEADMEKVQALDKELSNYDRSFVKYTLAVAKGRLCKTDEAGQLFKESIALEAKVSGEYSLNMGKRYHEAGRMYYAAERYEEAAFYFSRWVEVADRMYGYREGLGPVGMAWTLYLYASALEKSGKTQEAERVREREERIIDLNRESQAMKAYLRNKDNGLAIARGMVASVNGTLVPVVDVREGIFGGYPKLSECEKKNPVKE